MICPECGKEIDLLYAFCHEQNKYVVSYDEKHNNIDWGTSEVVDASSTKTDYGCPECGDILFTIENGDSCPPNVLEFMSAPGG